ncbi:unnamed protein product [Strongylus vulgaris]|uniref:Uncharacterized protein n=1 Tax=Strongylus vulgaris TaxID=40348 RepID=A0A3P7JF66_STRVU|nr:unnamed protein product [Strongylus vulgaris]
MSLLLSCFQSFLKKSKYRWPGFDGVKYELARSLCSLQDIYPNFSVSTIVKKPGGVDDVAQQPQKFTVIVDQAGESKLAVDE